MRLSPETLARASARKRWVTLGVWLVTIAIAGWLSSQFLSDALTTDVNFTNDPEAKRAAELVEDRFGKEGVTEVFILGSEESTVEDAGFEQSVADLQAAATDEGAVTTVSFYDTGDPSMVSDDGHSTLVSVSFEETGDMADHLPIVESLLDRAEESGLTAQSFGSITLNEDFSRIAEEDLARGETFGIMVALIVLVIVFGAVVAGVVPIVMAVASIAVAMGLVALVGQAVDFSFFVTNMITMMGLAVGIDYSLFIVSRYREERTKGREKLDAIAAAGGTASRAVFFSGMTVVLALIGMLIIPTTIFRSLAAGAIFVVVVSVLASLTLLPALLGLLGDRVNSLRVFRRKADLGSEQSHRFWNGVTRRVMARPIISLVLGAGILIAASIAYFDIDTGFSGVSTLPNDARSKQAFVLLSEEFSGGLNSPVEVVVDGDVASPGVQGAIEDMQASLGSNGLFGASRVEIDGAEQTAIISAPINADPTSEVATASIDGLRDEAGQVFSGTGAEVLVGGETAFNKDFFDLTDSYTPVVFAFVLGLSFLLLMVVFRSIVVPIKAIIMNLLSVGASYGLIVLVFQKGYGADLFGFEQVEAIEAWLPLFLFSVLFGLSMDYHVFLLSRIKEHFDQTGDNTESVAYGLRTTGGLITGAAAIMVAVFGGFAAGNLTMLQQMGFGLGAAVLIDATLVRSVLVPASMKLLGNRNWYLPKWLGWLPNVSVDGTRHAPADPRVRPEVAAENV